MSITKDRILTRRFKVAYTTRNGKRYVNLESFKTNVIIDPKYFKLVDDLVVDDDLCIKCRGNNYMRADNIVNIVKKLHTHPEHYNVHQIFGLKIKFTKQDEIKILAVLYDQYRHKYHIHYQHPELEFRMDSVIVLEAGTTGGLVIDTSNDEHNDHQKILEASGYYFIRIDPQKFDKDELIVMIDKEIENYQIIHNQNIDFDVLWNKFKNNNIDKQFFDSIGKSIVCNVKFCVDFNDAITFVGYYPESNAKHFLLSNFKHGEDFIMARRVNMIDRDDVLLSKAQRLKKDSNNDILIFLTKPTFYSFIISTNTAKAREIRVQMIAMYDDYSKLLRYGQPTIESIQIALNDYKEKQQFIHNNYVERTKYEIAELKQENQQLLEDNTEAKRTTNILNHRVEDERKSSNNYADAIRKAVKKLLVLRKTCDDKQAKQIDKIMDMLQ